MKGGFDKRQQQMKQMLESPLTSEPEDVAKAIWDVVQHPKADVVVGTACVATATYRFAPGSINSIVQGTMKS